MKMFSLLLKVKLGLFYELQKMEKKTTPQRVCCSSARKTSQSCFALNSSRFQTLHISSLFEG